MSTSALSHLDPAAALLEEASQLKVFPAAALRVQKLSRDPDATARDMANAVMADPVLASRLVRFANSPFYGVARQVVSIEDAIKILGFRQTQDVALALAIYAIGDPTSPYRERLWQHATGTAVLARLLAKYVRGTPSGVAFLAGLIHDIGAQVFLQVREEDYRAILDRFRDGDPRVLIEEKKAFGMDHAFFGAACLEAWEFPEIVRHAVAEHHRVRALNRGQQAPALVLPAIVSLSEVLVAAAHAGADPEILMLRAVRDPLNKIIGLTEGQLEIALEVFEEEREVLVSILS